MGVRIRNASRYLFEPDLISKGSDTPAHTKKTIAGWNTWSGGDSGRLAHMAKKPLLKVAMSWLSLLGGNSRVQNDLDVIHFVLHLRRCLPLAWSWGCIYGWLKSHDRWFLTILHATPYITCFIERPIFAKEVIFFANCRIIEEYEADKKRVFRNMRHGCKPKTYLDIKEALK